MDRDEQRRLQGWTTHLSEQVIAALAEPEMAEYLEAMTAAIGGFVRLLHDSGVPPMYIPGQIAQAATNTAIAFVARPVDDEASGSDTEGEAR